MAESVYLFFCAVVIGGGKPLKKHLDDRRKYGVPSTKICEIVDGTLKCQERIELSRIP